MKQKPCVRGSYALFETNNKQHRRKQFGVKWPRMPFDRNRLRACLETYGDHSATLGEPHSRRVSANKNEQTFFELRGKVDEGLEWKECSRRNPEESCVCTLAKAPARYGLGLALGMAVLLWSAGLCLQVRGQAPGTKPGPATAVADIKPLQIGDTIPEYLWHMPLQVVNHPEGKETITLNDYRGKLIILDFWATWCSSCIAAMPRIHQVRDAFKDKLAVLPVSWSNPQATEQTLNNQKTLQQLGLFSIVNAKSLIDVFPHGVVPHYAWIGPQGEVAATTASDDVSEINVAKVLRGEPPYYRLKTYIDPDSPLLFAAEKMPEGAEVRQYAVWIVGAMPSLSGGTRVRKINGITTGFSFYNRSLENIYRIVASKMRMDSIPLMGKVGNKRFIEVRPAPDNSVYTLDFIVPASQSDSLFTHMLAYLNQHSGRMGKWVAREIPCWVLTRTGRKPDFISGSIGNLTEGETDVDAFQLIGSPISQLVNRLNWHDISGEDIVVNETGYHGQVSVVLRPPFDIGHVRNQLNDVGLDLISAVREVEVFELN